MSQARRQDVWKTLSLQRRRGVVLLLAQMARRRIQSQSFPKEAVDGREPRAEAGRLHAREDLCPRRFRATIKNAWRSSISASRRRSRLSATKNRPGQYRWSIGRSIWLTRRLVTIDDDLGLGQTAPGGSDSSAVAEVGPAVGLVLGIEMSRPVNPVATGTNCWNLRMICS